MGQRVGQLSHEAANPRKVSHGALDCPTDLGQPKVREIRDLTPIVPVSQAIGTRHVGQPASDLDHGIHAEHDLAEAALRVTTITMVVVTMVCAVILAWAA